MTGVCWDVSERKRAEEERQKFVSLVEQTDDFVGMVGLNGAIMFLNRAGCRLVGLDVRAIGTPFEDSCIPPMRGPGSVTRFCLDPSG